MGGWVQRGGVAELTPWSEREGCTEAHSSSGLLSLRPLLSSSTLVFLFLSPFHLLCLCLF